MVHGCTQKSCLQSYKYFCALPAADANAFGLLITNKDFIGILYHILDIFSTNLQAQNIFRQNMPNV